MLEYGYSWDLVLQQIGTCYRRLRWLISNRLVLGHAHPTKKFPQNPLITFQTFCTQTCCRRRDRGPEVNIVESFCCSLHWLRRSPCLLQCCYVVMHVIKKLSFFLSFIYTSRLYLSNKVHQHLISYCHTLFYRVWISQQSNPDQSKQRIRQSWTCCYLLLKKLRYSSLIVNVFLYCFMALKPARSISQIWCVRSISFLTDFLMKLLFRTNRSLALKLLRSLNVISVLLIKKNCTHFINSCIRRRSKTAKIIL